MDLPTGSFCGLPIGDGGESEPSRMARAGRSPESKSVNLALQGGGAHGAFAWGVLDRLLVDDGKIADNAMKRMLIHGIEAADVMAELSVLTKLDTDWDNLTYLMKVGRERADAWLNANCDRLGKESTIDIREKYF